MPIGTGAEEPAEAAAIPAGVTNSSWSDRLAGRAASVVALVVGSALAWFLFCSMSDWRDHALDDSFINYVYGRNLAEGHGLRFNAGDPETTDGASSLTQVLLTAAAWRVGIDPLAATRAISLAVFFSIPVVLGLGAARVTRLPPGIGFLSAVTVQFGVALQPETRTLLVGGMETMVFTGIHAWVLAWVAALVDGRSRSVPGTAAIGTLLLLALTLARPEGAILAAAYLGVLLFATRARGLAGRPAIGRPLASAAIAFAAAALVYTAWRVRYFGHLLPNPYFVKLHHGIFGTAGTLAPGLPNVLHFLVMRWIPLLGLLLALAVCLGATPRAMRTAALLCLPSVVFVLSYVRVIHEAAGAFRYEYPYQVPLWGLLALSITWLWRRSRTMFGAVLVAAACLPALLAAPVPPLLHWVRAPLRAALPWITESREGDALGLMGRDLADTRLGERATILLSGAGQVPYYSHFFAIDWIGLNNNYLSGRTPRTLDEVWQYIDSYKPDVVYSFLPPAAAGISDRNRDPGFLSSSVQSSLAGRGCELFKYWNHQRVADMFYREMCYVRDHYEFGAVYALPGDWALMAYVRRNSPHRDAIQGVLRASHRADWHTDLSLLYVTDPRQLRAGP